MLKGLIDVVINLYLVVIALWVFDSLLDTFYKLYEKSSFSTKLPIKGNLPGNQDFNQWHGCHFYPFDYYWINRHLFFSGLGALTAVLLASI